MFGKFWSGGANTNIYWRNGGFLSQNAYKITRKSLLITTWTCYLLNLMSGDVLKKICSVSRRNKTSDFTSLLILTPLHPLTLPHFLCQLALLFPFLPVVRRPPFLLLIHLYILLILLLSERQTSSFRSIQTILKFLQLTWFFWIGFQITHCYEPGLPLFCWCLEAGGNFPAWLNPPQCPISGLLYSVQLDKPLNSVVPSAPQACPLFAVYLFSLHGLHNIAGTQKTMGAQSRIARGSESAKKGP